MKNPYEQTALIAVCILMASGVLAALFGTDAIAQGKSSGGCTGNCTFSGNNTFNGTIGATGLSTTATMNAATQGFGFSGSSTTVRAAGPVGSVYLGNSSEWWFYSDNVGNMTATYNLKVEGYHQVFKSNAGAPTAGDCDNDAELGRMVMDTTNERLYVCNGAARGWDYSALTD